VCQLGKDLEHLIAFQAFNTCGRSRESNRAMRSGDSMVEGEKKKQHTKKGETIKKQKRLGAKLATRNGQGKGGGTGDLEERRRGRMSNSRQVRGLKVGKRKKRGGGRNSHNREIETKMEKIGHQGNQNRGKVKREQAEEATFVPIAKEQTTKIGRRSREWREKNSGLQKKKLVNKKMAITREETMLHGL